VENETAAAAGFESGSERSERLWFQIPSGPSAFLAGRIQRTAAGCI
jgi:hypothetical protein